MFPTHALHAKYKEQREYYDSYKYKKCPYPLFRARFVKWVPLDQSIRHLSLRIKSDRVNETGRECTKCKEFKHWVFFSKMSNGLNGHSTDCLDCRNLKHRKERMNKDLQEKEKQYKRDKRSTEEWKTKTFFDNIYYQDPRILKNREILKSVKWNIDKTESVKSKIEWLVNKWYDSKLISKLYNTDYFFKNNNVANTRY